MKPLSIASCIIHQNSQWSGAIAAWPKSTKTLIAIQPYMPTCHDDSDNTSDLNGLHASAGTGSCDIGASAAY